MPYLGAHMSIAGGVSRALLRGAEIKCEVVQLFVKNNVQWRTPPLSEQEVARFRRVLRTSSVRMAFAHACYLINLASPDDTIFLRSRACLLEEYTRCVRLGLPYIIFHPGSHRGAGVEFGIQRVATGLDWILSRRRGAKVKILLETTAGQGNSIGFCFEQLAEIIRRCRFKNRLGVCLDTCHIFSAGYDIRTIDTYKKTMRQLDKVIGLENLHVIHLNDSKGALGSRLDRHTHIGKGQLGITPFRLLLNDHRFIHLPMVIETPKEDGVRMDIENLALLRRLLRKK
ncbi:deoxyribonuclease IV [Candidatus Sumerlaeota bacterium]|nr:deoxyribonuclease IV [Candidatus Sumerlaeota bacterium]